MSGRKSRKISCTPHINALSLQCENKITTLSACPSSFLGGHALFKTLDHHFCANYILYERGHIDGKQKCFFILFQIFSIDQITSFYDVRKLFFDLRKFFYGKSPKIRKSFHFFIIEPSADALAIIRVHLRHLCPNPLRIAQTHQLLCSTKTNNSYISLTRD